MLILNPNQSVSALVNTSQKEIGQVTAVADTGAYGSHTVTAVAYASTGEADYVVITSLLNGEKTALWIDKNDAGADPGSAPSGAAFLAADHAIEVNVTLNATAAQIATAIYTAAAGNITGVTVTNPSSGVVKFVQTKIGVATAPVPHNVGDTGAGSLAVATVNAGAASNYNSKYFLLSSALNAINYYAWFSVGSEGSDPSVAGRTAIAITMAAGATASGVAAAIQSAVDAKADFVATQEGAEVEIKNATVGTATDVSAGNSPLSVITERQGYTGTVKNISPGTAVDSLSNNPS